ncbi:MAG: response regulator [Planctomycetota bacterium]
MSVRVLIVDDEEAARFSLPLPLEDAGFAVETAADGREALELIRSADALGQGFGFLVLDIEMPHMNGIELLDALIAEGLSLPTVVISGYGDKATLIELLRRSVDDFLDKPFNAGDLLRIIDLVLEKWEKRNKRTTSLTVEPDSEMAGTQHQRDPDPTEQPWCVEVGPDAEEVLIQLRPGVCSPQAEDLRQAFLQALDAHPQAHFRCRCITLEDIDPVVLSVLLRFSDLLREAGRPPLALEGLSNQLAQFFNITNAIEQFHLDLGVDL